MAKLILLLNCFVFVGRLAAFAQNLLPNRSFEDINICCERDAPCSPEGWFAQRIYPYQRDFISMEPIYNTALSGNTSIELEVGADNIPRQYAFRCAVAPLLMPLVKGKTYVVTINVLPKLYAVKELHVVFSDSIFPNIYQSKPDITFTHKIDKFIIDGRNWVELQALYEAKGGERYLHLGMIKPLAKVEFKRLTDKKGMGTYYIDDVSLTPLEEETAYYNLDSARHFIYNENRRHDYDQLCPGSNILFTSLLKYKIDSTTTLPGILNRKCDVLYDSKLEQRNVLYKLSYTAQDQELDSASFPFLTPLVIRLKKSPNTTIVLKGHVHEYPKDKNAVLISLLHAKAVATYLINQGIDASRISVEGMGSADAIGNPNTPKGNMLNNRIEYILNNP